MGRLSIPIPVRFNVAEHFLDRHLQEGRSNEIAVFSGEEALTYGQVVKQANRAANLLARAGVQRRERVMLLLRDSPAFVAAFWGAIKRGAVAVPVNTLLTEDEYNFMLRDSGASALVVDDVLLDKVAPCLARPNRLRGVWVAGTAPRGLKGFLKEVAKMSSEFKAASTRRNDPAFWLYTSGSTGRPKAAIHRHRDMVVCLERYAKQVLGITARDRTFSTSKLFFAYGLGNGLYFSLGVGASTVLLAERPTPEKILEILRRHQPTMFFSVPAIYSALLQSPGIPPDAFRSVRCAVSAGEALPAALWQRFRERFDVAILDGIGSTEMLHMFISNRPDDVLAGSSGKPVPGYEARIVNERGEDVPVGQLGDLLVRGESAAAGYWRRPELTRRTFPEGWAITGDRYSSDDRGYYFYHGRSDDMLKVSGMWVSPLEVENALMTHSAVMECAVVGAADSEGLIKPKAFVVLKAPAAAPKGIEDELREFLKARLAKYKIPRWFAFLKDLPRTATGKIQRYKLREAAANAMK